MESMLQTLDKQEDINIKIEIISRKFKSHVYRDDNSEVKTRRNIIFIIKKKKTQRETLYKRSKQGKFHKTVIVEILILYSTKLLL